MKIRFVLPVLAVGILSAWPAAAQVAASGQANATAQSQTSVQANSSGAQASSNNTSSGSAASSANVAGNPAQMNAGLADGSKVDATLATSLDAKRSKVGDEVEARTEEDVKQDGKVILKKGTHLVGHVTEAQARAKGQADSSVGIIFDHAVLKNGEQIPFNASVQAIAAARSAAAASAGSDDLAGSGSAMGVTQTNARGRGLAGGVTSTAGAATGTVVNTATTLPANAGGSVGAATRSAGAVGGLNSAGRLASNSSGVFGLDGLSLNAASSNAAQGSVIASSTKNVHLDSGTQMLLQTGGQVR